MNAPKKPRKARKRRDESLMEWQPGLSRRERRICWIMLLCLALPEKHPVRIRRMTRELPTALVRDRATLAKRKRAKPVSARRSETTHWSAVN